jgi:N-methylhydantoinase A/oxoprolinase/acetone carboxylase beta subunit
MHACELAERLDIPTIIVPRFAGVLSALGMLLADVTRDYSTSVLRPSNALSFAELGSRFKPLLALAQGELRAEGFGPRRQMFERLIDMRYIGQSYEITLPFMKDYRRQFDHRHEQLYGYSNPARPTEIVNLRLKAVGIVDKPELPQSPERATRPRPNSVRPARFGGKILRTAFYRWEDLSPGCREAGPAVVTGGEATAVIQPGFGFRLDRFSNLIIRRRRGS